MYIIGSFEYGTALELAIKEIKNKGVNDENILCLPLDKRVNNDKFFDTIHRTDGRSTMGIPFLLATFVSLFGAIYGFVWEWGPIIWGGLGFLIGGIIGLCINWIIFRLQKQEGPTGNSLAEVILIVNCDAIKEKEITQILWEQYALGVAKFNP